MDGACKSRLTYKKKKTFETHYKKKASSHDNHINY